MVRGHFGFCGSHSSLRISKRTLSAIHQALLITKVGTKITFFCEKFSGQFTQRVKIQLDWFVNYGAHMHVKY